MQCTTKQIDKNAITLITLTFTVRIQVNAVAIIVTLKPSYCSKQQPFFSNAHKNVLLSLETSIAC